MSLPDSAAAVQPNMLSGHNRSQVDLTTVSGAVLGIDGYPIRNTAVELHSLTSGRVLATAISSLNGSFEFTQVPPGEYEVVASQGINQAHQRVHCMEGLNTVTLRMETHARQASAGGDTISVTALRVPEKARDLFQKAEADFHKNKLEDAWKGAEKALKVAPNYSEALTLRAILRIAKGDRQGGEQDLQASIKSDSNYPLAYFAMGAVLNIEGRFTDAQKALEQGLRVQPTSWQGYFELSKSMLGQSNYRTALKYIVRAESMGAKYAPMYLVKAHALMGLKFYGDAASAFEHYLQLDPMGPEAAGARKSLQAAQSFVETASAE